MKTQKVGLIFTIHDLMKDRNKQLSKRLSQERASIFRENPIEAEKIKSWQAKKITSYGHSKK
jgi:predicted DNA-binding protein